MMMLIKKARSPVGASLFLLLALLLVACEEKPSQLIQVSGSTMGTWYTVNVRVSPQSGLTQESLQKTIDHRLEEINQVFSTYIPDSELSQLNATESPEPLTVSDELAHMLELSQQIYRESDGAFDVTVGPLVNLWGFGPDSPEGENPSPQALQKAAARVDGGAYALEQRGEDNALARSKPVYIDMSAIAKGYGADLIGETLTRLGVQHYMVEIGGELSLKGNNGRTEGWVIGIEQPSMGHTGAVQAVMVSDVGMATSGDYRNYYERDGERLSHTINPTTGRPITHLLASVTVIAPTCAQADGYATAINVLGPEKGMEFAEKNGLAAFFIIRDGDEFALKYTPEFEQYLVDL